MAVNVVALLIPVVALLGVFTFVSVSAWAEQRTREREAYYRADLFKKLVENPGPQVERVLEILREQEKVEERRRQEGQRLGGLVVTLIGVGLAAMLWFLVPNTGTWSIGLIPFFVGVALLIWQYVLAPRGTAR